MAGLGMVCEHRECPSLVPATSEGTCPVCDDARKRAGASEKPLGSDRYVELKFSADTDPIKKARATMVLMGAAERLSPELQREVIREVMRTG